MNPPTTPTTPDAIRARVALLQLEIDIAGDVLCDTEHAEIAALLDQLETLESIGETEHANP